MRNTLIVLTTAAAIAAFGGCSTQDPGQATTAPPTSDPTSSSEETSSSSVPDLSYDRYIGNECSILTPAQLGQLGQFKEPKTKKDSVGSTCRWSAAEDGPAYEVTFVTNDTTIEDVRSNSKSDPVYKELDIEGYPAVSTDQVEGVQNCLTAVGTSQKGVVMAQLSIDSSAAPEYGKACEYTEKLAKIVLGNLRG